MYKKLTRTRLLQNLERIHNTRYSLIELSKKYNDHWDLEFLDLITTSLLLLDNEKLVILNYLYQL